MGDNIDLINAYSLPEVDLKAVILDCSAGPIGTRKSFLAAGLCHEALRKGYRACFRTMDQLNYLLNMKDITRSAGLGYALLLKTNLLVIDDTMMFPLEKNRLSDCLIWLIICTSCDIGHFSKPYFTRYYRQSC